MKVAEDTKRIEWLNQRKLGIGGSDAAAACGLSPWKSRYQLWHEKTSPVRDDEPTEPMIWGTLLEPVIRQRYCEITGKKVFVPRGILKHQRFEWCLASLDGVTEDDRIFEAKTASTSQGWGEDGSDEIPELYQIQVQHYMAVTGATLADVAVLIGASDFRVMTVEADAEMQAALLEREAEFWELVVRGTPPEPETEEDVRAAFPRSNGKLIEATSEQAESLLLLKDVKQQEKEIADVKSSLELYLKAVIGDADGLQRDGKPLVTWKSARPSKKFDTKAFAEAHPDLYAKFVKETAGSRRFLVK